MHFGFFFFFFETQHEENLTLSHIFVSVHYIVYLMVSAVTCLLLILTAFYTKR